MMNFHTNCPFPILYLKEGVAVCVLVVYAIPNSFFCVSLEDFCLADSSQRISDFYKSVILKQQRQYITFSICPSDRLCFLPSIVHHISGTFHYLIIIFGTHI